MRHGHFDNRCTNRWVELVCVGGARGRQTEGVGVGAHLVTTATTAASKATTVRATPVALTVSASLSARQHYQGQLRSLMTCQLCEDMQLLEDPVNCRDELLLSDNSDKVAEGPLHKDAGLS